MLSCIHRNNGLYVPPSRVFPCNAKEKEGQLFTIFYFEGNHGVLFCLKGVFMIPLSSSIVQTEGVVVLVLANMLHRVNVDGSPSAKKQGLS